MNIVGEANNVHHKLRAGHLSAAMEVDSDLLMSALTSGGEIFEFCSDSVEGKIPPSETEREFLEGCHCLWTIDDCPGQSLKMGIHGH